MMKGRHIDVPALHGFPRQKEIYGAASALQWLRLVEPVVFLGKVYGACRWAGCEQAQLQEVFNRAGVGGDGVVLGHADLVGHGFPCLLWVCGCPFHRSGSFCGLAGSGCARGSVIAAGGALAGEAAAHLGKIQRERPDPFWVGPGLSVSGSAGECRPF